MSLGYNEEDGRLPILDNSRQKELLAQCRAYQTAIDKTDPPPSRLDFGALSVGASVGGEVEVTADMSAPWWGVDGRALSYESQAWARRKSLSVWARR